MWQTDFLESTVKGPIISPTYSKRNVSGNRHTLSSVRVRTGEEISLFAIFR